MSNNLQEKNIIVYEDDKMTEKFNNWNSLKQKLQTAKQTIHIKQGEIYFMSIGQNIGYETYGKGDKFLRPVLVYKKLSRYSFIGIPLTSKVKEGTYFFSFEYKKDKNSTAILSQMRSFDTKRISYYSGNIKKVDFEKLKNKVQEFMDITPKKGGGITSQEVKQRNNKTILPNNENKVKITIPNNNILERKYILDIIFNEFLGLDFEVIEGDDCQDWIIELPNKKVLSIKDTFFSKYPNDLEYLKLENIPKKIEELDIFASSFFMLTRWEEYVNKNRDSHNRFPATESLAHKQGFLDRPIVNEYVEELKKMLLALDNSLEFKIHNYQLVLTHDVDSVLKYTTLKRALREIIGDIFKRKNIKMALSNMLTKIQVHLGIKKDPFDTFDYLMDLSEKVGVKSYFFFMGQGLTKYDNMYKSDDTFVKDLILKIKDRGHHIGIHPSYNAYNTLEQFKKEKEELENNLDTTIPFGREHYLRFEVPTTWQIWEDNCMKWDSTLSYADKEGFRCGVCYEYSVFNILTRKKLKLKEKPLIVMEGSFATYQPNIKPIEMEEKIRYLIEQIKKYNGEFVFLWHNSSFNCVSWKNYKNIYERILRKNLVE